MESARHNTAVRCGSHAHSMFCRQAISSGSPLVNTPHTTPSGAQGLKHQSMDSQRAFSRSGQGFESLQHTDRCEDDRARRNTDEEDHGLDLVLREHRRDASGQLQHSDEERASRFAPSL
eukprot:934810-Prymnesium_polylepis.2